MTPGRSDEGIPAALAAGDVMARPPVTVEPGAPTIDVLLRMAASGRRALVVVERGFPIGIVTGSDLVARGAGPGGALAGALDAGGVALDEALRARLAGAGRSARDVMTPEPVTVDDATPLRAAAELLARRRLRRLPVVGLDRRLVGVLSRLDVLRAAAGGGWDAPDGPAPGGLDARAPVAAVMRTRPPVVAPGAPFREVLRAVATSGVDRALVVDGDGRVLGVVTDAALLDRMAPPLRRGVFSGSVHGLPFGHQDRELAERRARARTAADMMTPAPCVAPDLPLGEAIARVLPGAHKLVAVVDGDGRLVGALDRADILRGLVR
jgi:CBS domain-containing protein